MAAAGQESVDASDISVVEFITHDDESDSEIVGNDIPNGDVSIGELIEPKPDGDLLIDELVKTCDLKSDLQSDVESPMPPHFNYPLVPDRDGNFSCTACEKKYKSKNHLRRHISIVHLDIKRYPCTFCGKRFHSSQPLRIHIRTHTGEKPCKCADCGKAFSDPSALRNHERMHNPQLGIMCDICGKYMATQSSMRNHRKRHEMQGHDKSMYQYHCPECSYNFCTKADLECHIANHRGEKIYPCQDCPKFYTRYESYQYHRRTHTGEKPFQCKECGTYFRSWNLLKLHSVVHQDPTERRRFPCHECGKVFAIKKALKFHRCNNMYPCWVCKTIFPTLSELEEHKLTHTVNELRRHLCQVCGRRFSKSSVLKKHKCKMLVIIDCEEKPENDSEDANTPAYQFHVDLYDFLYPGEEEQRYEVKVGHNKMPASFDAIEVREPTGHHETKSDLMELEDYSLSTSDGKVTETDGSAEANCSGGDLQICSVSADPPGEPILSQLEQDIDAETTTSMEIVDVTETENVQEETGYIITPTAKSSDASKSVDDVSNGEEPASPKEETESHNQLEMNAMCLLDRSCQKCGGDFDKEISMQDSWHGGHICPQKAKRDAGPRKFLPLRKTVALKPLSPRRSRLSSKRLKR